MLELASRLEIQLIGNFGQLLELASRSAVELVGSVFGNPELAPLEVGNPISASVLVVG